MNKKNFGLLLDLFDGRKDLNNKLIKTCIEPKKTFKDDPLRMLRAIRFASQLSFDIESKTFQELLKIKKELKYYHIVGF